jgi:cytochrome c oxidase subunit 1
MSTTASPEQLSDHSANVSKGGIWSRPLRTTGIVGFLTTVDHKKIGIGYAVAALFFFIVGGVEALIIRLQLMTPRTI